jgi:hypothetical protein
MMHFGRFRVNATMLSGRIRRRFTTAPWISSAATLQLFLPRSIPIAAILIGCTSCPFPVARSAYAAGWRGGPFHKLRRLVAAAIPEHARGKPVELWWQDEARVGQQGTLTRLWAERGSRPPAPRDCRYDWAYIFGAVCPARGTGAALVLPYANAEAMNLHLAEISRRTTPGAHTVVTMDGAGWHQEGGRLQVPDNISVLLLPPYSPQLRPSSMPAATPGIS